MEIGIIIICLVLFFGIAEFFGRRKHIGRWWTFLLLAMGFIPGIIAILFSPSSKNTPTHGKVFHQVIAWIFGIFGILSLIRLNPISLSFICISVYLFCLSKGLIKNDKPKFYFKSLKNKMFSRSLTENSNKVKDTVDLDNLYYSGILSKKEYNEKKLKIEEKEFNLKNIESLQKLHSAGILNHEEYDIKRKLLVQENEIPSNNISQKSSNKLILKLVIVFTVTLILGFVLFQLYSNNYRLNFIKTVQQTESNSFYDKRVTTKSPEKFIPTIKEPTKITKYIVISFQTKEAEISHLEGSSGLYLPDGYHKGTPSFTTITYTENNYKSSIIEIIDYNENKLFFQKDILIDELKNKLIRNDETVRFNLSSGSYQLSRIDLMNLLEEINSEITNEKIYEFDSYKEASLWKNKN